MSHVLGSSPDDDDSAAPGGARQMLLHEIWQLRRELAAEVTYTGVLDETGEGPRAQGGAPRTGVPGS